MYVLASVHPGRQVPVAAVVLCGAVMAAVAFFGLPHVTFLADLVSFGAIIGFIIVNLSVIVHFGFRKRSRLWLRHWVAPGLGVLVLVWVLSGMAPTSLLAGVAWMAVGAAWMAVRWLQTSVEQFKASHR